MLRKKISIEETGKTVEEAIDNACKQLGVKREECTFEIIDLPRKRLFGLRVTPAKVRVSIDMPEDMEEKESVVIPKVEERVVSKPKKDVAVRKATVQPKADPRIIPNATPAPEKKVVVPEIPAFVAKENATMPPKTQRPDSSTQTDAVLVVNPEK